jgi:hypothetical protein
MKVNVSSVITQLNHSVEAVLRRRGHVVAGEGSPDELFPSADSILLGQVRRDFFTCFGSPSFRKLLRKLAADSRRAVPTHELEKIAGRKFLDHLKFLLDCGIVVEEDDARLRLAVSIDNIGGLLEWYVADLCERELCGSAAWSVRLEDISVGGDYDVIAWVEPALLYIEVKSSARAAISDHELRRFLQRGEELSHELAVLLIDTSDDLSVLLDRMTRAMAPAIDAVSGIKDLSALPAKPYIRPQLSAPGINWGMRRFYVVGSRPSEKPRSPQPR